VIEPPYDPAEETASLGPLTVSRPGLGCNVIGSRLDLAGARRVVDAALATKFGGDMGDGNEGGDPGYIARAVEASLRRLRTDRIDLLYYHWPDEVTPIADTVGAMAALVESGIVRAIGVSNVTAQQLREAAAAAPIAAVQNEYSLLVRDAERDVVPLCRELGAGFVPYYPLAAGLLTGKYRRDATPPPDARLSDEGPIADGTQVTPRASADFALLDRLTAFAADRGRSLADLAIAALLATPGVASVITGAMTPEQVRQNAAAAAWALEGADMAGLAGVL
jgi:aryl-alcohol dehydrogenase-like predicted oxidoreductase